MRVSILIPAYNAAKYVGAAIESVRAQTFDDWEIVAVDDASSDETEAILRGYAGDRVRVERNVENLGMTANWNRCLSLARGELVLKLDADDALKPRALEMLAGALEDAAVLAAGVRTLSCDEALEPFDGIPGDNAMLRAGLDPYRDHVLSGERWYDFAAFGHQLWASSSFMV
ncbi:MAG TPA: glycosyltransferase family 2 protein, partial [Thermoanaerobaculia bacterium]|nr:glycosyltransferase family 2 protein [Thermoanaerobaculia bacterium]